MYHTTHHMPPPPPPPPPSHQILGLQLLLDCVRAYNAVAGLLPLLPLLQPVARAPPAAPPPGGLPKLLGCEWRAPGGGEGGPATAACLLPLVSEQAFEAGESWQALAEENWGRHGMMQVRGGCAGMVQVGGGGVEVMGGGGCCGGMIQVGRGGVEVMGGGRVL